MVASVAKGFVNTDLVFSTANEADFPGDLQLSDWGEDVVVGLFATRPHMTEKLSHISLCQFIQDYLDGSQQLYLTSEVPAREVKNALVMIVVGSTFKKIVLNPEKNVVKLCVPLWGWRVQQSKGLVPQSG
jgi:hypothetical protein